MNRTQNYQMNTNIKLKSYQQGVPTNVFRVRCLSPESKRQAETPKSPSLIAPRTSIRIFPAYRKSYNMVNSEANISVNEYFSFLLSTYTTALRH